MSITFLYFQSICSQQPVFALARDFASLYTLWGELSQNQLTNASALSLPGEKRGNTQNWPKKFVYYRKRRRTYFIIEMGEIDMKARLFYLILPAYSDSRENSVISRDFSAFYWIFNLCSVYSFTGETVKTTTDQRNSSIIGSDDLFPHRWHISS